MKRRYKFLLLILGITALVLTFVDTRQIDGWVKESIIEAARGGGTRLSITSLRTRIIGAEAEDVVLAFPKMWATFRISSANSSLSLASILAGRALLNLDASLYGGAIRGDAAKSIFSSSCSANVLVSNLKLAEHPQLLALGISKGELSGEAKGIDCSGGEVRLPDVTISLKGVSKPEETRILGRAIGTPFDFILPAVSSLDLSFAGALEGEKLLIKSLSLSSSLANGSGQCTLNVRTGTPSNCNGSLTLTASGVRDLGPYLALMCPGAPIREGEALTFASRGPRSDTPIACTRG